MLEVGNGMSLVRFRHLAVQLKTRIDASARIEVVPLSEALYEVGWQMFANRPDKDWGLVDCILKAAMIRSFTNCTPATNAGNSRSGLWQPSWDCLRVSYMIFMEQKGLST
jgi:uncharacterized protein